MPDLLTHLAVARVPGTLVRNRTLQALLIFGTFLPDLAGKAVHHLGRTTVEFVLPFHSLAGAMVLCYLASLLLEERSRQNAFAALYAGALIHLGLDLIKDNLGYGSASLLYPFSTHRTEFGWIGPENVVLLIPFDLALLGTLWILERRRDRVHE